MSKDFYQAWNNFLQPQTPEFLCFFFVVLYFSVEWFFKSKTQVGRHASVSKRSFLPPKAMESPRRQPWAVQRGGRHFWFGEKTMRVAVKLMIQKSSEQKLIWKVSPSYLKDLGLYHPNCGNRQIFWSINSTNHGRQCLLNRWYSPTFPKVVPYLRDLEC